MDRFGVLPVNNEPVSITGSGEHFIQFVLVMPNSDESFHRYGKEKIVYDKGDIIKLSGNYGSIRYLYRDQKSNQYVGALQLEKKGKIVCRMTIFTMKEYRNQGIATRLVEKAKRDYGRRLVSSNSFTEQGARFFGIIN